MKNIILVIVLSCLCMTGIPAQETIQKVNSDTDLNEVKGFDFVFSQKGWRYSTLDSTYIDYNNVVKDTTFFNGDQFIHTNLLQSKFIFTNEEKLKIYAVAKKVKFDLLPDHLELKNIYYFTPEYEQTISIYSSHETHTVSWDGIYPDLGNNEYVLKHRRFVDRYKELSDTIYSILIKKVDLQKLYLKNGERKNPITVKGINLNKTGFPKKYIPKIGKYRWGIIAS